MRTSFRPPRNPLLAPIQKRPPLVVRPAPTHLRSVDRWSNSPRGPEIPATSATATARLLHQVTRLYNTKTRHAPAEPLLRRALAIAEASCGMNHPEFASDLHSLATLYGATNRIAEAEAMMGRKLRIAKNPSGNQNSSNVNSLRNPMIMRE